MKSFYLGADVSKGYADFVILDEHKRPVTQNFQLDDTHDGHSKLFAILAQQLKEHPGSRMFAAVESTGGYENNWFSSLQHFGQALNLSSTRLNPLAVMHNSKADLKRNTTDKISARSIAEYLIAHREKVTYSQSDPWAGLRKLWGFHRLLSKQCSQTLNELEPLLYSAQPGLVRFCKDKIPNWLLQLLLKYPTADRLARAKVKTLAKIPYLSAQRAKELVDGAKQTVACSVDPVTGQLIQSIVGQILALKKTIALQETRLIDQCDIPEVELLKTFKGIGDVSAIGLMLEIQTVTRFASAKKLASFCGLHPVFKTSGDGTSAVRMSKQGRREPRRILFMVALAAIRSNPLIRQIYERHLANGKAKMAAIGVCMHKILRIVYGMLKNQTPFDPQVDRNNRKRSVARTSKPAEDKNRRFQRFDPTAPISRRQTKKRLEREQPQCVGNTVCGVKTPVPEA